MHETLTAIKGQLTKLVSQVQSAIPGDDPLGNAHGNWSFPGLTRSELVEHAQSLINLIDQRGSDEISNGEARLKDYSRRIDHLVGNTVGQLWSNAGLAVPAYILTLEGLRKALEPALARDSNADNSAAVRRLTQQIRAMEARLKGLEPRTTSLSSMVERIEKAHDAADQLPTDLESLSEAQRKVATALSEATKDQGRVLGIREEADRIDDSLKKSKEEAAAVLARCETTYSAATSVGLAAAFSERSRSLGWSMWIWVTGLIAALVAGAYFGSQRLRSLEELLAGSQLSPSILNLNIVLSLLSVAAPVWFAWLATKQIGQRFRLAEDYAFKASVSRAYEGYRREAARVDKDMEAQLLASALARLDELPLRLVETESHGSPWHELASSEVVKQAMKAVPGFAGQVQELAGKAIHSISSLKSKGASKASDD